MPDSRACPESAFLQDERSRILSEAMDKLTLRTRTVIELRELGELSTREAAEIMGLSVGSVKAQVFQGRKKLRQVLKCECIAIQASKQWGNLPYLLISSEPVTPDSKWLDTLSSDGHPHPHSNGRVSRPSTLYAARYQCFASPLGPRPKWQSACIPAKECN